MNLRDKILEVIPIDGYINRFVPLKKRGASYFGCCPFHNEKTPSFSVNPAKGFYHCFGCKASGNVITFAMEYHGLDFKSALEVLAKESGIDPNEYSYRKTNQPRVAKDKLILERAKEFYEKKLYEDNPESNAAREYLTSRGLSQENWHAFSIGYAPKSYDALLSYINLKEPLAEGKDLERLALARPSKHGDGYYGFFRDRIVFPIQSKTGDAIAFGGRTMEADVQPKYINSSNTDFFDKSVNLYNIHRAMRSIRENNYVYLVEGYLDVIGLAMKGIHNSLAPLGTSLTEKHLRDISISTREIHFLMDGDVAGIKSALRGVRLCQEAGIESKVVLLPPGQDPYDFCQANDDVTVLTQLDATESGADFRIKATLLAGLNDTYLKDYGNFDEWIHPGLSFEEKRKLTNILFAEVETISSYAEQELLIRQGADRIGVKGENLWADYVRYRKKPRKQPMRSSGEGGPIQPQQKTPQQSERVTVQVRCERELIGLVLLHPALGRFRNDLNELSWLDEDSRRLAHFLIDRLDTGQSIALKDLYGTAIGNDVLDKFTQLAMKIDLGDNETTADVGLDEPDPADTTFWELFNRKSLFYIEDALQTVLEQIHQGEAETESFSEAGQIDKLRGEMVRLKKEKIKLQEAMKGTKGS